MSSSSSRVVEITEIDELEKIAKEFSRNLIVMDFSATWCMPCKSIKPFFKEDIDKNVLGKSTSCSKYEVF